MKIIIHHRVRKHLMFALLFPLCVYAQTIGETIDKIGKNFDVNVYLRTSYEASDKQNFTNGFKVNEARTEIMGNISERLVFRTRWRMNRQVSPSSVSNAPSSLDYAYIAYTFGEEKRYTLTLGKQRNNSGGWEFIDNPTYEYQYSQYISRQPNAFPVGAELSYKMNSRHSLHVQGFNPSPFSFDELHTNAKYAKEDLEKSKAPLAVNFTWKGSFWKDKFQTSYNVGTAQIARGKRDFQVSLGNKWRVKNLDVSLDLHHTTARVDYTNMISSFINGRTLSIDPLYVPAFARDMRFQSAVLRANYTLTSQWFVGIKTAFEQIHGKSSTNLERHRITKTMGQFAVEYKPFLNQNFKVFGYYAHFQDGFSGRMPRESHGVFSVGALWFLNAL